MTDLYNLLGVEHDATQSDIAAAYRRKAKKCHPDVGGEPKAFLAIAHAYSVLSDAERRERYDRDGDADTVRQHTHVQYAVSMFATVCQNMVGRRHMHQNPGEVLRDAIENDIAQQEESLKAVREHIERWTVLNDVFDDEPDADPEQAPFRQVTAKALEAQRRQEASGVAAVAMRRKALEYVAEVALFELFDERMEVPEVEPPQRRGNPNWLTAVERELRRQQSASTTG